MKRGKIISTPTGMFVEFIEQYKNSDTTTTFQKITMPLHHSQWQEALDKDLVDNGRIICFEEFCSKDNINAIVRFKHNHEDFVKAWKITKEEWRNESPFQKEVLLAVFEQYLYETTEEKSSAKGFFEYLLKTE